MPVFSFCVCGMTASCFCQINESRQTIVYDYLYRMAQKGLVRWMDIQMPMDRRDIRSALTHLAANEPGLSGIERSELTFYLQEYAFDSLSTDHPEKFYFLKKDNAKRVRPLLYQKGENKIFLDPIIGSQYFRSNGKDNLHYFSGIRLAGYFGKHWGVNFLFRENTEKGDTLARDRNFSSEEGIIPTASTGRLLNYSNINFNIGYRWSNGSLSAGKENLAWGYGTNGSMILSGKAPSYPYIKLDYKPWDWLHFSYFHGWLHSNIIDSAQSYNTGTGVSDSRREVFHSKYIAHHSISVTPTKGLDIAIGESMVYSDRLNLGYLVPVSFFRAFDHYTSRYSIKAGDNSQFFGLISSRNHIKNTHLYAQLFIDEIRASRIFSAREKRNQLGYTIGINSTDLFLHYLTVGMEYSRINPFVYNNLIPTQTFESHAYLMGDWMGNNADRLYLFLQYTPLPRLKIKTWHQQMRKGAAGTLYQQYFQQPQPAFLFQKLYDLAETGVSANYEWLNKLVFSMRATIMNLDYINSPAIKSNSFKIGFSYGL
ncbi:MAG TPA: capsule assembly Wzi family protein [Flavisolibacter sp.]|nr:capsule assembly Wzi family protein [Flavisolibacter sp.]